MNHEKSIQCVEDTNCSIRQTTQNPYLPIAAPANNKPETVNSQDVFKLEVLLINNVLKTYFSRLIGCIS